MKKIKAMILVLALFALCLAGCSANDAGTNLDEFADAIGNNLETGVQPYETEENIVDVEDEQIDPTEEATAAPTTEPTTAPTTEPTTAPTTEPTTAPTTEPTTAPTTEPPHVHNFVETSCDMPLTCSCGLAQGEAKGHRWQDATCLAPMTCTACGETDGAVGEHNYSDGSCTICGASDPSFKPITYILNVSSMKFHELTCGWLPTENRQDTTMSREEIIEAGYEPCKRCNP